MASVAWHFFNQYRATRQGAAVRRDPGGYGDGEQRRDFVSVEDVVKVNLWFLDHPEVSGIFNVGTGRAQSFNDVARGGHQRLPRRRPASRALSLARTASRRA